VTKNLNGFISQMWGYFHERMSFREFQFVHENEFSVVQLSLSIIPVLRTVMYKISKDGYSKARILDAKRMDWNIFVQKLYFPLVPFDPTVNLKTIAGYKSLNSDAVRWLYFDIDYHVQTLIPQRPVKGYVSYVRDDKFEYLVREFGGVNPSILESFLPFNRENGVHQLVYEAMVIEEFTERMKISRRVWLTDVDCEGLLRDDDEIWVSYCERLEQLGVLTYRDGCIALSWAAKLFDQYAKTEIKLEYKLGVVPTILNATTPLIVQVDHEFPIDKWIDGRQLPVSVMRGVAWEEIPSSIPDLSVFAEFTKLSDLCNHVRSVLAAGSCSRTLCVSNNGEISFDENNNTTCQVIEPIPDVLPKNRLIIVTRNINAIGCSLVVPDKNQEMVSIPNSVLFSKIKPISACTFLEVCNVNKKLTFDKVILIVDKSTPTRFIKEAIRFPKEMLLLTKLNYAGF